MVYEGRIAARREFQSRVDASVGAWRAGDLVRAAEARSELERTALLLLEIDPERGAIHRHASRAASPPLDRALAAHLVL